jgi:hypothetical protein
MILDLDPVGLGFDFFVFREIGNAVLQGYSPYSVPGSFYPPAMSYAFSLLAIAPQQLSFVILTVLSCAALATKMKKRSHLLWLLYWPVAQVLYSGQTSLLFLPLIPLINNGDRRISALGAALFTLKPQLAMLVLPWHLVRWIMQDRRRLLYFVGTTCALQLWPMLIRPSIFMEWLGTVGLGFGHKTIISAGIWSTGQYVPPIVLAVLTTAILVLGIMSSRKLSRAALTLASPVVSVHDTVLLMDAAPMWLLLLISVVALTLTRITVTVLPGMLIAGATFVYRVNQEVSGTLEEDVSRNVTLHIDGIGS